MLFFEGVFQAREAVSLPHRNHSSSFKENQNCALVFLIPFITSHLTVPAFSPHFTVGSSQQTPFRFPHLLSLYHRSLKFRFISLFAVEGGFDLIGEAKKAVRTGFGEENSLWESFWKKVLVVTAVRIS
ncbi:unnamed protein product [Citrullus colocynthis]|uniref:Uncharacterized protein n=1 Tax=Citrullus colocynthis TaxID=252529 RepID=A0ABP0YFK0_9ROSI